MSRTETIADGVVLHLGDCREIIPTLGRVDAVITDPPYGIELAGKSWSSSNRKRQSFTRKDTYLSYDDTAENFESVVVPAVVAALSIASCGLVFMADKSLWKLPAAEALGGIFSAGGTGRCSWGFKTFTHCAFYGRDPYLAAQRGARPTAKSGIYPNDANEVAHPCAKPIDMMTWAVDRASLAGQVVIDPFMGSGTTGVAAVQLGRRFIGIEIEPKYFDIACRRIQGATKQTDFFIEKPKPKQLGLLDAK